MKFFRQDKVLSVKRTKKNASQIQLTGIAPKRLFVAGALKRTLCGLS